MQPMIISTVDSADCFLDLDYKTLENSEECPS